ncbi:MAG: hypothetical protein R3200_15235 [Xanthomonadales bacterium]|nr:hypothetical protein [Xanthomonadales bacterium]
MQPDRKLFTNVPPPQGGLTGLRARIRRRRQQGTALATVLAVVATAWLFVDDPHPTFSGDLGRTPLARLASDGGHPSLRIREGQVLAIESARSDVRLYWVVDLEERTGNAASDLPEVPRAPSIWPLPDSG